MQPHSALRVLLASSALAGSGWILQAAEPLDVHAVVAQVGERVAAYYQRAQRLVCVERSTVLPIDTAWRLQGFGRTVESELRLELDGMDGNALPDPRVSREITRINGREPRQRDDKDRRGCTDPTPLSPEPLAFLLPAHREEYRFTAAREGRERDRAALIIDYASARRTSKPQLIEDENGHADCFDWKGPIAVTGRVWVDAASYDVLKLERHIAGPTDVRVPGPLQSRYHFTPWLTIDRDDLVMRYKEFTFTDPDEVMLLPESIETLTIVRSGLQSMRRTQTFSDYRRFLTRSRIKGRGSLSFDRDARPFPAAR